MADVRKLRSVFGDVRELLALPDNDFDWSSWRDAEHALEEIDGILAKLSAGIMPQRLGMEVLFTPTGPICEVAVSSGWGQQYVDLGDRFDAALDDSGLTDKALSNEGNTNCPCYVLQGHGLIVEQELGMDAVFGETTLLRCPQCAQLWLKYLYELEGFTGSGRWYLGAISRGVSIALTAEHAKRTLESLEWYFCGGSYFNGQISKLSGPIVL